MKKLSIFAMAALLLAACQKPEPVEQVADGGSIAINFSTSGEVATRAEGITLTDLPTSADFALKITGSSFEKSWNSFAGYDYEEERLTAGKYNVYLTCGDATAEGYDKPAFAATATDVVVENKNKVTNLPMTAKLANAIITIRTTEKFDGFFPQSDFTITTATSTIEYDKQNEAHLFVAPQSNLKINCTAIRQSNLATETKETLAQQVVSTVEATTRYVVTYDLSTAGSVNITVKLNDTLIDTISVDTELNENA